MIKKPKTPMIPEDIPNQNISSDCKLVPRPNSFHGKCNFLDPMDEKVHPTGSPRNVDYLGAVEWAWGPSNNRFDSYYLNPRGRYWLLWLRWLDENEWEPKWRWTFYAYGPKKGVDAKAAATYLLMDAWKAEKENSSLDHFFLIDEEGSMSASELLEIARIVWPEATQEKVVED